MMNRPVYEYEKAVINMLRSSTEELVKNYKPIDNNDCNLMIKFIDLEIEIINNSLYKKELFEEDKKYNDELKNIIKVLKEHRKSILSEKM